MAQRVLPKWLCTPTLVEGDISAHQVPTSAVSGLCPELCSLLEKNGITSLFPVQSQLIPAILEGQRLRSCGYQPPDICCSAPTGSGKTLAYVLPIIQCLRSRKVRRIRALIVLPVLDLAVQIHSVISMFCQGTSLTVGLLVGQKPLVQEEKELVRHGAQGLMSLVDIVVATPGRLVDHLNHCQYLDLSALNWLVLDEADRLVQDIEHDWLQRLHQWVQRRDVPMVHDICTGTKLQAQKLLFSATLTHNPEHLEELELFEPRLYTATVSQGSRVDEYIGTFTTPAGLKEYYIICEEWQRPLVLAHLLLGESYRGVLCFCNTVQTTRRLYLLLKLLKGIRVQEFSSALSAKQRHKMVKELTASKVDVLVSSDAAARGMDLPNVQSVISYQCPQQLSRYVHRVGRTARAGRTGTAITLLLPNKVTAFKQLLATAGKQNIQEMTLKASDLEPWKRPVEKALKKLSRMV